MGLWLVCALLLGSLPALVWAAALENPPASVAPPPVALESILQTTWQGYKAQFIQTDGRVIDPKAGNITTSEGQSYAMLRAVWLNDRPTFDAVYTWSVNNLRVRGDQLFAWKWGPKSLLAQALSLGGNPLNEAPTNEWGVLDATAATDADVDIALALLMAYERWQNSDYLKQAQALLNDIWLQETAQSSLGPVLLAGDWYKNAAPMPETVDLNPSYFAPYAYRLFAQVDKTHPWQELVNTSYTLLEKAQAATTTHLPPDWVWFNRTTGELGLFEGPQNKRSDYGYEALRSPWRLALDAWLFGPEAQAQANPLLAQTGAYLSSYWQIRGGLPGPLSVTGIERPAPYWLLSGSLDSDAQYGALLPAVAPLYPAMAQDILNRWVVARLNTQGLWVPVNDYYAQNWLWFGLALYQAQQPVAPKSLATSLGSRLPWAGHKNSPLARLTFMAETH